MIIGFSNLYLKNFAILQQRVEYSMPPFGFPTISRLTLPPPTLQYHPNSNSTTPTTDDNTSNEALTDVT